MASPVKSRCSTPYPVFQQNLLDRSHTHPEPTMGANDIRAHCIPKYKTAPRTTRPIANRASLRLTTTIPPLPAYP